MLYRLFGVLWLANLIQAQFEICHKAKSCKECLSIDFHCSWCESIKYTSVRCASSKSHRLQGCKADDIIDTSTDSSFPNNLAVTDKSNTNDGIYVSPQSVDIKLRVGQEYSFNITTLVSKNYPVDLYYLMDISQSMHDDALIVAKLGKELSSAMNKLSDDVRFGFGTFVDKPYSPFTSYTLDGDVSCGNCLQEPHSFEHVVSLTQNLSMFQNGVSNTKYSSNNEKPEGLLDALMQAIACQNVIGWRENSRHFIVAATDAPFHFAGDGRLVGAVIPNDGQCHMQGNSYQDSHKYDYPSVGRINKGMSDNQVQVVFACTEEYLQDYKLLSSHLSGSTFGELAKDSSNIVNLVTEAFYDIVSEITLNINQNFNENNFFINFDSYCPGHPVAHNQNNCSNIAIGEKATFSVKIKATAYDPKKSKFNFLLQPSTIKGKVDVSVEIISDCTSCKNVPVDDQSFCRNNSVFSCGSCNCASNLYGDACECSDANNLMQSCFAKDSTEYDEPCSGRGLCVCGSCKCFSDGEVAVHGDFCECDGNCLAGCVHGTCECGKCNCKPGYSGVDCNCASDTSNCFKDGIECNNQGKCKCNRCVCDADSNYSGEFCDVCNNCQNEYCSANWECVECHIQETKSSCNNLCININVTVVDDLDDLVGERCIFEDDDECSISFLYFPYSEVIAINDTEIIGSLWIQRERVCPFGIPLFFIILIILFIILLLGVLFLVAWKIIVTVQDTREYQNFSKNRANLKWDEADNPLFNPATTHFKNPTYSGSK